MARPQRRGLAPRPGRRLRPRGCPPADLGDRSGAVRDHLGRPVGPIACWRQPILEPARSTRPCAGCPRRVSLWPVQHSARHLSGRADKPGPIAAQDQSLSSRYCGARACVTMPMKTPTSAFRRTDRCTAKNAGYTPVEGTGSRRPFCTAELVQLLAEASFLSVIDTVSNSWGRSIPGAVGLRFSGLGGGGLADEAQDRLRRKMAELTGGDLGQLFPPPPPSFCGRLELRAL